jgi:hypothetical protein
MPPERFVRALLLRRSIRSAPRGRSTDRLIREPTHPRYGGRDTVVRTGKSAEVMADWMVVLTF